MKYKLINDVMIIKISSLTVTTIDEFLKYYVPSKKMRYLLLQNQWIKIDGCPVHRTTQLTGESLEIQIYPICTTCIGSENDNQTKCEIDIIFEDPFLVIVNKPPGMLVHNDGGTSQNLKCVLDSYYKRKGIGIIVHPLHRLDRETTGIVAFSKSPVFQPLFDKMVADKKIQRRYLAIVDSFVPIKKKYVFIDKIGKNRHDSSRRVVTKSGKEAKTLVVSLGTYTNLSLLKCTLYTGRTHQIRLHLSFHGMPIINDRLYGRKSDFIDEMGLFGNELAFIHPITEEMIQLKCNFDNRLIRKMELFS